MLKAYEHLYEDGFIPNEDVAEDFEKHLTPVHRKFFDSLSEPEKEIVHLSLDPFETLRLIRLTRKLYRKGQLC